MLNLKLRDDFLAVGRHEGCDVNDEVIDEAISILGLVVARPVGRLVVSK